MTNNTDNRLSKAALAQFTGSEYWYRHSLVRKVTYTDGARYVAQAGGAYWLLDEIALRQLDEPKVTAEEFQVWTLKVHSDQTATLTCEDGNKNVVYTTHLEFTDFPLDEIMLYFINNVILLPSEY